ncbi:MAG: hypothetical protein KF709_09975 [Gemmatimonadaceae bacterium]|nr:hypothetical protein [Gemmatimonadaceae bacterium]
MRFPVLAVVASTGLLASCIEPPLEPSNYFDSASGSKFEIVSSPDTIDAALQTFSIVIRSRPQPPEGAIIVWETLSAPVLIKFGQYGLVPEAEGEFRTTTAVGLIPTVATWRAYISNAPYAPSITGTVVLRQRPVSATLSCERTPGCQALSGLGNTTSLAFTLRDPLSNPVNLPGGSFRFGTVTSRNPAIASVDGRPGPSLVTIRAQAAGSTWIVLAGEGVADSMQVTVTP